MFFFDHFSFYLLIDYFIFRIMKRRASPEFGPRGGPNFWQSNVPAQLGEVINKCSDIPLLDKLNWNLFYESRSPVDWEPFVPQIIEEQSKAIVDGIEKFQLHRWKNAIPNTKEKFHVSQRVKDDLKVLQEVKKLNITYTRHMQQVVKKCGLEEQVTLKHLLHRVMTAVGKKSRDAHPPPNMKEYRPHQQKCKENKGNMYKSMFLVLDYWVDARVYNGLDAEEDPHPLFKMKREMMENSVYFIEERQVQVLGGVMEYSKFTKLRGPIYDTIGIVDGDIGRFPRLYHRDSTDVSDERAVAFLKYLHYKGVGGMVPKHTALYFAHPKMEPFHQVLAPIGMHRYKFNRWARHYYKCLFDEENHTCSSTGPYPFLDNGKKKMNCDLETYKKRLVAAAGHDPSRIPFEHMTHAAVHEEGGGVEGILPSEWEEESQRVEFCFHRNPHSCARCCATDPVQEFFVARTRDHPFLVCYHPIHLNHSTELTVAAALNDKKKSSRVLECVVDVHLKIVFHKTGTITLLDFLRD